LEKLQASEANAVLHYKMVTSSLEEGLADLQKDMQDVKTRLPEKVEIKSVAAGDLETTMKDLLGDARSREALHHECLSVAEEFQASVLTRQKELKALADAQKAIQGTTGGAASQTYLAQTSLLQVASLSENRFRDGPIQSVRALATELGSAALAQLASRMSSAMRFGTAADPFSKVKVLLGNMIQQLEDDADGDAMLKSYCDREMSTVGEKEDDVVREKDRVDTHRAQKIARSNRLTGVIATLQRELGALARAQEVARQIRNDEHAVYIKNEREMQQGLRGIKLAVKILRQHYQQDSQSKLLTHGASGGIIGMLEVVETDFSSGLAELIAAEETAASYYESTLKPSSEFEAAAKEHDMKQKIKEHSSLEKAGADLANDAARASEKLSAIHQYEAMLKSKCSKPDTFEERKQRREKELAGLKDVLLSLAGESYFLQSEPGSAPSLRGSRRHTS